MELIITQEQIDAARKAGACSDGLQGVKIGMRVDELSADSLDWCQDAGLVSDEQAEGIVAALAAKHGLACEVCGPVRVADVGRSGSGSGSGYGSGYGYGSGSGSGSGSGYGYQEG